MKKRILAVILCIALAAAVIGCGNANPAPEAPAPAETEAPVSAATTSATEAPVAESTAAPVEKALQSGTVTFHIDMTQYEPGKTVRVWLPVSQSDDYQVIENLSYSAGEITEDATGNKMLYIEWGADVLPADRTAALSFHVTRDEILRPELIEEGTIGEELSEELSEYLTASSMLPVTGAAKDLADEITANETTVLGKARAIYDWIIANMNRDNSVIGCGQGDVCVLLDTKAGKCTDINSVFVSLCRCVGIPAREMFGVRINDAVITKNQHCWAEFYLPGTGWVIADPADVLKAVLTNSWEKDSDETRAMAEYYWGGSDEKRVELSRGRDLILSPAQEGAALNNFGYPYAEVDGVAVDFYSPDAFIYSIEFMQD